MESEAAPMRDINSSNNGTNLTWRSPVPYLFGGIGAMLALIAIALIILVCPFLKSSRRNERNTREREADCGNKSALPSEIMEDKVMVIMAGDENPSFLAQPVVKFPFLAVA